jgi:hypothetical protein
MWLKRLREEGVGFAVKKCYTPEFLFLLTMEFSVHRDI